MKQDAIEVLLAQRRGEAAACAGQRRADRAAGKVAAQAAADLARGAPPPACSDWHMDADMVPSVLSLWEMCMVSGFTPAALKSSHCRLQSMVVISPKTYHNILFGRQRDQRPLSGCHNHTFTSKHITYIQTNP